jgi:hypothetical protein
VLAEPCASTISVRNQSSPALKTEVPDWSPPSVCGSRTSTVLPPTRHDAGPSRPPRRSRNAKSNSCQCPDASRQRTGANPTLVTRRPDRINHVVAFAVRLPVSSRTAPCGATVGPAGCAARTRAAPRHPNASAASNTNANREAPGREGMSPNNARRRLGNCAPPRPMNGASLDLTRPLGATHRTCSLPNSGWNFDASARPGKRPIDDADQLPTHTISHSPGQQDAPDAAPGDRDTDCHVASTHVNT